MSLSQFRAKVSAYLTKSREPWSSFGRRAVGDSAWTARFLEGYVEPKEKTRDRVIRAIASPPTKRRNGAKS